MAALRGEPVPVMVAGHEYVSGGVDFLFGNATAVFDQSTLRGWPHIGGTIVASTDEAKKQGLLITNSKLVSSMAGHLLPRPTMTEHLNRSTPGGDP